MPFLSDVLRKHVPKARPISQRFFPEIDDSHSSAISETKGTSFSSLFTTILPISTNTGLFIFPSLIFEKVKSIYQKSHI